MKVFLVTIFDLDAEPKDFPVTSSVYSSAAKAIHAVKDDFSEELRYMSTDDGINARRALGEWDRDSTLVMVGGNVMISIEVLEVQ